MTVITSSDFRANQGKWLDLARQGERVVVRTRSNGDFKIMPLTEKPQRKEKAKAKSTIKNRCKSASQQRADKIYREFRLSLQDWKDSLAGDESKMRPISVLLDELRH